MYPDATYREYLLGVTGPDIEADIEEAILGGQVDPEHLFQIEEELIDDLLFDRLSAEEVRVMQGDFLSSPRRAARLEFSRALQSYAARHALPATHRSMLTKVREWVGPGWLLPLTGALAFSVVATVMLAERDAMLRHELAVVSRLSDERQRTIASLQEQQNSVRQPTASIRPNLSLFPTGAADQGSTIELSPGVTRGISSISVLHLPKEADTAIIVLELPFEPSGSLREELLDSNDKRIWSQQFGNAAVISVHGLTTIALPAGLLASGDYHLRAENAGSGNGTPSTASYFFRVRKD